MRGLKTHIPPDFTGYTPQFDDITMIGLKFYGRHTQIQG